MPQGPEHIAPCITRPFPGVQALVAGVIVILLGFGAGAARAESSEVGAIDHYVLRPDVIYRVRIASVSPLHSDMTEPDEQPIVLGIEPLDMVGSRLTAGAPTRVEVMGIAELNPSNDLWTAFGPYGDFVLTEGEQYLFFLERESQARFRIVSAYRIDDVGVVCGKDTYIHGFGAYVARQQNSDTQGC